MEKITAYLIQSTVHEQGVVRAWEETILLPTYEVGKEEKNPIFLEKRVYQGSSGAVYPYGVIEKVADEKKDKAYKALFIENEYIKIMILPELGGRIHMAYDKVQQRHFVYYNQVIKPALVGLTGPWISGGIEFNWPQHHRPSTFMPTDYAIERHDDGSITVWCNEVERMFRTKGMQGFRLYPGKSYIEIQVKVYNRTAFPQTFLWWSNPAVVVNDGYHSVFPPDVHAVFDHGKRAVSNFPIATGEYYKQDYSAGVDISKYKNIPVPTSYMAVQSKFDFVGGYEEGTQAGLLHVANHHVSPGKKQWTWGNGDFGQAWDRNLTDEDGPYIELMTGVYTDNQPDFSWLQVGEEKSWTQYFMPYAKVGYVKNANKDALVNVEVKEGNTRVVIYTTSVFDNVRVVLQAIDGHIYIDDKVRIAPDEVYEKTVFTDDWDAEDILFKLFTAEGKELLTYQADTPELKPIPDPAVAAQDPQDIASIEQLFLTGHHLEQYRHATYQPLDYYLEALRREPTDIRCNNAVGLLFLRKGQFEKAAPFFRQAIATQTLRNPNPYEGEPHYNLGCCLRMLGQRDDAYATFFKATWNAAWQDAGYYALAQIDVERKDYVQALDHIDRALIRNWHHHKARQLKASILRKLGRPKEALSFIEQSLEIDGFNMGCRFEKYVLTADADDLAIFQTAMRGAVHTYIEYALDFAAAGLYEEASQLLRYSIVNLENVYPMVYYALGYFASQSGHIEKAKEYYEKASTMSPSGCFPNRIEEVRILQDAICLNPTDARAPFYLGNFWYAARQYEDAINCWEQSMALDANFPTVLRNLALAYYNKLNKQEEAKALLEKAFQLDTGDARIFMELDQLYKKMGIAPQDRLGQMNRYPRLVDERDDLCIERIKLYNQLGQYQQARELIAARKFHPWEGGEGKITKQYILCQLALAQQSIAAGHFEEALTLLHETDSYPLNLGEGKLANVEENDIDYWKGVAYRALGKEQEAISYFQKATAGMAEPQQAYFYNDQQPDKIYYQGLAWQALGEQGRANSRFNKLVDHGKQHLFDDCKIDYFAVSLPDLAIWEGDLNKQNKMHCYYVMGLGYLGLGDTALGLDYLTKVQALDIYHLDSLLIINQVKTPVQ